MFHSKVHIEEGDLVILYMVRDDMTAITIKKGQVLHNKFGRYRHEDMIGMKYGSKMHSPPPQSGYVYLLRPTPELWTLSLPHRTQILYMTDIAYIIMRLGVRVGGKVIEAGTGSGSMTHSLSRAVGKKGQVGSYEYHAPRCEKARAEFEEHGLTNVQLQHRNVCKDGFGDIENVESVFLDLPAPWEAIPHAIKVLRPDVITKICCFSPCLEQVLKTVSTLREYGFSDISTQEVLTRTHELQPPPLPGSNHLRSIDDIVIGLHAHEKKKEERRLLQMKTAREKAARIREERARAEDPEGTGVAAALAEMLNEELAKDTVNAGAEAETGAAVEQGKKRKADEASAVSEAVPAKRTKADATASEADLLLAVSNAPAPVPNALSEEETPAASSSKPQSPRSSLPENTLSSQVLLRVSPEMRGHTSYLTFATFYPAAVREAMANQGGSSTKPASPAATVEKEPKAPKKPKEPKEPKENAAAGPSKKKKSTVAPPPQAGAGALETPATEEAAVAATQTTETETEYGDPTLDNIVGTLTEEELIAFMGA